MLTRLMSSAVLALNSLGVRLTDEELPPVFDSCLAAAYWYASHGFPVFPLSASKRPLRLCGQCANRGCPGRNECRCGVDTCHGFYAASTDPDVFWRWWREHPGWQIGIRTGAKSGLAALDVDLDKGGLASLQALAQQTDLLAAGPAIQLSGSGESFHLIYRHPGGRVACSVSKLGPGLDVRGDGGYVVAAPSRHPATGRQYQLRGNLSALPQWPILAKGDSASVQSEQATHRIPARSLRFGISGLSPARVQALVTTVRQAPPGTRRSTLFWASCRLGECTAGKAALKTAAGRLWRAACDAGLGPDEAFKTLTDGIRWGQG